MREAKFRAWDIKYEKMYFSHGDADECNRVQLFHGDWEVDTMFPSGDDAGTIPCDNKSAVLMQYTGLKDKNDKGIFEGDIVRLIRGEGVHAYDMSDPDPDRRIISFDEDEVSFELHTMDNKKQGSGLTFCKGNAERGCFEVIGNIHESPELITP